jgi:hypothetical protein
MPTTPITSKLMKVMGLKRLDAFRRADLTPELRKKAGLTVEDEHRLTACVELALLGLPVEAAEALALSGAIGSASEFSSLTLEELERVFQEEPVTRLLPAAFQIDRAMIEGWIGLATPLTADENAPGRTAVPETDTLTLARDEDLSIAGEDVSLSADLVGEILASLEQNWTRTQAAIKALTRTPAAAADGNAMRAALADLQGGLAAAMDRTVTPVAGGLVAPEELLAPAAADEGLDPAAEVQHLQGELTRLEARIEALKAASASGSEESSSATATEAAISERETSPRGE